jgi:hypothetical protein
MPIVVVIGSCVESELNHIQENDVANRNYVSFTQLDERISPEFCYIFTNEFRQRSNRQEIIAKFLGNGIGEVFQYYGRLLEEIRNEP